MLNITNILYPINLDSKNHTNVITAIEISIKNHAAIHFLYVNEPAAGYRTPTDFQEAVALKIKEVVPAELIEKADIKYAVSKGDLGDQIREYCKNNPVDLIITSHKQRSRIYTSLLDTPDEDIIDTVNVPILLLPKK